MGQWIFNSILGLSSLDASIIPSVDLENLQTSGSLQVLCLLA